MREFSKEFNSGLIKKIPLLPGRISDSRIVQSADYGPVTSILRFSEWDCLVSLSHPCSIKARGVHGVVWTDNFILLVHRNNEHEIFCQPGFCETLHILPRHFPPCPLQSQTPGLLSWTCRPDLGFQLSPYRVGHIVSHAVSKRLFGDQKADCHEVPKSQARVGIPQPPLWFQVTTRNNRIKNSYPHVAYVLKDLKTVLPFLYMKCYLHCLRLIVGREEAWSPKSRY